MKIRAFRGPARLKNGWTNCAYLNKQMMATQAEFLGKLGAFVEHLPAGHAWCIEPWNPSWLNDAYFDFLRERGLAHVFPQGYYMPTIFDMYEKRAADDRAHTGANGRHDMIIPIEDARSAVPGQPKPVQTLAEG